MTIYYVFIDVHSFTCHMLLSWHLEEHEKGMFTAEGSDSPQHFQHQVNKLPMAGSACLSACNS